MKTELLTTDRPCVVYISDHKRSPIPAKLIGVVPSMMYEYKWISGSPPLTYTTKALIKLESFSKGQVVEMTWDRVTLMDEPEEYCKTE